jgi:signal transduction histidine kinase
MKELSNNPDILIVEDSEYQLQMLADMLEGAGYSVRPCNDGALALRSIEFKKPDLILLDIILPDVDGYEICRLLKNRETTKDIPVIFITLKTEPEDIVKAFEAGGVDYITKPYHLEEVLARVKTHLQLYKTAADLRLVLENLNHVNVLREQTNQRLENVKEADRLKSAFLSTMSHEIRTPLSAMIGYIDLTLQETLSPESEEYLNIAKDNGHLLLNIISDILDISRIEAGHMDIINRPFSLKSLVRNVDSSVQILLKKINKDISITHSIGANISDWIIGDSYRIQQVLINLLSNSVKFTSEGRISFGFQLIENNTLGIFVKDTGTGIPTEHIDKIFNPFHQIDFDNSRKYGGTGLGLPIVKRLVELMGGRIRLESHTAVEGDDHGTTFFVTLPYMPTDEIADETVAQITQNQHNCKNKIILVADDNKVCQRLSQRILEKENFTVITADDGQEVVDIYASERKIDLILMDIQMPGKNGLEAAAEIRKVEAAKGLDEIPIIALSAYAMLTDIEKGLEAGCSCYLTKPVNKIELMERINYYFSKRESKFRQKVVNVKP